MCIINKSVKKCLLEFTAPELEVFFEVLHYVVTKITTFILFFIIRKYKFQFSYYILLYLPENMLTRYVLFEFCGRRLFRGGRGYRFQSKLNVFCFN